MKNTFTLSLLCVIVATACNQINHQEAKMPIQTRSGAIVNENPYSLANVQIAYNDLMAELQLEPLMLSPTHKYVKFNIVDSLDYKIIHDDLGLELIEYPLDRDLTEAEMEYYLSNDSTTEYYTAVPANFTYPTDVEYEILDDIYMQSEGEVSLFRSAGSQSQISNDVYNAVIERSMQNNGIEIETSQTRASIWYPSATIEMQDDRYWDNDDTPYDVIIPLQGVKVRCTNFINVGSGITDENGRVSGIRGWGGRFRNAVGYHIIWENSAWNIREGKSGQAKTHGPKKRSHWDKVIEVDNVADSFFAAVHRALWAYFYETYPLTSGITIASINKMNTGVMYNVQNTTVAADIDMARRTLGGNVIYVYGKGKSGERYARYHVTRSMFHELGHATHWQAVIDKKGSNRVDDYHAADKILKESWAKGVEYAYTQSLYPDYYHYYDENADQNYTAAVESMLNQGMTLKQIEDAMVIEGKWTNWRANVIAAGYIPAVIVNHIFDNPFDLLKINARNTISGPSSVTTNAAVMFSASGISTDITLDGWTISPSAGYATTSSMTNKVLSITFSSPGTYTLTANYTLSGDVPWTVTKTVTVTGAAPWTATISGDATEPRNTPVSYRVSTPPAGVTFDGWSITPSTYTAANGTANTTLNIQFANASTYTLKANFTLPGGAPYVVTKTVTVKAPEVPTLTWEYVSQSPYMPLLSKSIAPVTLVDTVVKLHPLDLGIGELQWMVNGIEESWASGEYSKTYNLTQMPAGTSYIVSCRNRLGNEVSAWSNELFVTRTGVQSGPILNPGGHP